MNSRSLILGLFCIAGCGSSDTATISGDGPTPGCVDGDIQEQRHGTACLCCHSDEFGVAGSVDSSVARVLVVDADGQSLEIIPNAFGNFFRHERLALPLRPAVEASDGSRIAMQGPAPSADCNACHRSGGTALPLSYKKKRSRP